MLGKVLKYDIKLLSKNLIPLYVVLLGLALVIRLLSFFEKLSIINIVLGLMIVVFIFALTFSFFLTGVLMLSIT